MSRVNVSLVAASLFGIAPVAFATGSTQVFVVSSGYEVAFEAATEPLAGDIVPAEVWFPRSELRAIIPTVPAMGPEFDTHMRVLAKILVNEAVFGSDSSLAGYFADGTLAGLELKWMFPIGSTDVVSGALPDPVTVFVMRPSGPEFFAMAYGFDAAGYEARKDLLEEGMGRSFEVYPVWSEDLISTRPMLLGIVGDEGWAVVSGVNNQFHGPLGFGGYALLGGQDNRVHGVLASPVVPWIDATNVVDLVRVRDLGPAPPLAVVENELRARAMASGTYVEGKLVIQAGRIPPSGLVFAEGGITVAQDGLRERWTLVSANGPIRFVADGVGVVAFAGRVSAAALRGDVEIFGNRNRVVGEIHALGGHFDISGDANEVSGIVVARSLHVGGGANVLTDGTYLLEPADLGPLQ